MRLVKSSTMGAERLIALTLMQCHRDINLDPEKIVDEFAQSHSTLTIIIYTYMTVYAC